MLKRCQYIYTECKKLGITVVSFEADGNSRELKSMLVSTNLMFASSNPLASLSPSFRSAEKIVIPSQWRRWFAVVKLKCRLIKSSIVLPLGGFVAGVHHLCMVHFNFSKEEHALREQDINDKDKQNYEAVLRMTSESMLSLLQSLPDAKGTIAYLNALRCVIDSYFDKSLKPLDRVKKAWFSVFFVRYWHQWIMLSPDYIH